MSNPFRNMTQADVAAHNARTATKPATPPSYPRGELILALQGQVHGGKNSMGVSRDGKHYPRPLFARWRDDAVRQIKRQLDHGFKMFTVPLSVEILYVAGDERRRDAPGTIDAIWHVLEKAGIVEDDSMIWNVVFTKVIDKTNPRATIALSPLSDGATRRHVRSLKP